MCKTTSFHLKPSSFYIKKYIYYIGWFDVQIRIELVGIDFIKFLQLANLLSIGS